MKKNLLIAILSLLTINIWSQNLTMDSEKEVFVPQSTISTTGEINVLTKIVGKDGTGITTYESEFEYELDKGKEIERKNFELGNSGNLFIEEVITRAYNGNTMETLTRRTEDEGIPLTDYGKDITTYETDNQDLISSVVGQVWSDANNAWENDYRQLRLNIGPNSWVTTYYDWDEINQEYFILSKEEIEDNGNNVATYVYNYDQATSTFIPTFFTDRQYVGDYFAFLYLKNYEYNATTDDYDLISEFDYKFNVDGQDGFGYRFIRGFDAYGDYVVRDSASYNHNDQYQYLEFTSHRASTGFQPNFKITRTFNADNKIATNRFAFYNSDTQEFDVSSDAEYFYSDISITSDINDVEDFGVELQFQNPSSKNDFVSVVGELNTAEYEFWITNQRGSIIYTGNVMTGDQIALQNLDVSGMYYVTLFGDKSQKTWKLIVQ